MSDGYNEIQSLEGVVRAMRDSGVVRLFFKTLVKNNNDKQQIYITTDMAKIGFLPSGDVEAARSKSTKKHPNGRAIFRTSMPFHWLNSDGRLCSAPSTKLIYYPQYPEVRISGFLERCEFAPNGLLSRARRGKEAGRILFLGVTGDGRILGHAVAPENAVAKEIGETEFPVSHGVLREILLDEASGSKQLLLEKLAELYHAGWVNSVKLTNEGPVPYDARSAIGYTLESHFGVMPNGNAKPDWRGWELKGTTVKALHLKMSVKITAITKLPECGLIKDIGFQEFVLRYGYRNEDKPPSRIDINGDHLYGIVNKKTGFILNIEGYKKGVITDEHGGLVVTDRDGVVLMKWPFEQLITHWKTKHANTVYVPAMCRLDPVRQYRYGHIVKLAQGTSFYKLLEAIKAGHIIYDPASWVNPLRKKSKQRGQYRVKPSQLTSLYQKIEDVDVLTS